MTDERTEKPEVFSHHRPVSIRVTRVFPMPDFKNLPDNTIMTINLKLDISMQDALIEQLLRNRNKAYREPLLAITLEGIS